MQKVKKLYRMDTVALTAGAQRAVSLVVPLVGVVRYIILQFTAVATNASEEEDRATTGAAMRQAVRTVLRHRDHTFLDTSINGWHISIMDAMWNYVQLDDAAIALPKDAATTVDFRIAIPYIEKARGMEYMHDRCPRWENIRELLITFTPPAITDITWSALQCEIEIDYMPYHRMAAEMRTRMSKILMDDTEPKLNQSQEPVVGVTWIGNFNDASTFWTGGVVPQITLEGNGDEIYTDKTYDDIQLAYLQEQPHEGSPGLYVTQAAADPFTHFFPLYFPPEEYANTKVPDVQLKLRYIGDTPKTDFQYLREVLMDQTEESIIKRVKYSDQLSPQVRNRMLRYKLSLDRYRKMSVKPRKLSRLPVYFNPMLGNDDYAAAQPVINELPPNTIMPVSPETARDENKDASPGV